MFSNIRLRRPAWLRRRMLLGALVASMFPQPSFSIDMKDPFYGTGGISGSGGTNGTYVNSSGIIVSGSAPRYDHDPVTLQLMGWLIEGASTNMFIRSGDFSNAAWTKTGLTATLGENAPDNSSNGAVLEITDITTEPSVSQTRNNAVRTIVSCFIKAGGASPSTFATVKLATVATTNVEVLIAVNLADGTFDSSGTYHTVDVRQWRNGWWRVSLCVDAQAGQVSNTMHVRPGYLTGYTVGQTCLVWGGQCEETSSGFVSSATSYIPTTTATVNRTSDTLVAVNSGGVANDSSITLMAEFAIGTVSSGNIRAVLHLSDGTGINMTRIIVQTTGVSCVSVTSGGISQASINGAAMTLRQFTKVCARLMTNNMSMYENGALVGSDLAGTVPGVTNSLRLGTSSGGGNNPLNGWIREVKCYRSPIPEGAAKNITA